MQIIHISGKSGHLNDWCVCVCCFFLLQYNQNNFGFSKRKKKHNSSKLDGSVIYFTFGKSINMLINVVPPNNS